MIRIAALIAGLLLILSPGSWLIGIFWNGGSEAYFFLGWALSQSMAAYWSV